MAEENKEHYVFLFFSIHLLCMLNAVAADAANAVLTVEITKRRRKKRRTTFRPLLHSRSELGACDLLLTELRATDTQMYANFTRVSPAEFDFLLCAIREQITGFGLWRRPGLCGLGLLSMAHADSFQWIQSLQYSAVPRNRYVDLSTSHACRQRDVIGCNNLRSWIFLCNILRRHLSYFILLLSERFGASMWQRLGRQSSGSSGRFSDFGRNSEQDGSPDYWYRIVARIASYFTP